MQAATIAGIAGGVLGLGAAGAIHLAGRSAPARAEAAAREEWDAWKSKLDAEFPDRSLTAPGSEDRFEAWLAQNPAPSWIRVEYEDLRTISIDPFDPVGMPHTMGGGLAVGAIGAAIPLGLGGAALRWSERSIPSALRTTGGFAHAFGGALGLALIGASFAQPKVSALHDEIEATEWHRPSKWYH